MSSFSNGDGEDGVEGLKQRATSLIVYKYIATQLTIKYIFVMYLFRRLFM